MVKVGFAKQDLQTALRPALPVREERIEAIALYLSSAAMQSIWITLDFMDFDLHMVSTLTMAVEQATGIDPAHIHIVTTHNHGGGEPDPDALSVLAVRCAQKAMESAVCADLRWCRSKAQRQVNIIRRYPVPELGGVNTMYYGAAEQNGFNAAPFAEFAVEAVKSGKLSYSGQQETSRPVMPMPVGDDDIFSLQFRASDGSIIGTVVRFAAHAVCCNLDGSYSSDYPYHVRKSVEEAFGGICLFWNGPCGDIAPCMTGKTDGTQVRLGKYIAEAAAGALKDAAFSPLTTFHDASIPIALPVRQEIMTGAVNLPGSMPDALPLRREYLEARLLTELMVFLQSKYRRGETAPSDTVCVSLGLLRLNDLLIAAFPGETFSVTGNALKKAFSGKAICTVTEHGRTVMYLPPECDCRQGGYESVCRITDIRGEAVLRSGTIRAVDTFLTE